MSIKGALQQQLLDFQSDLFCLGNQVDKQSLTLTDLCDYIPGSVMIQDLDAMTNLYMNKFGCDILHQSSEELTSLGAEYFRKFFPAEELLAQKAALTEFLALNDPGKVHSFLQRVRPDVNTEYNWYFTSSRLIIAPENPSTTNLVHIAVPVNTLNLAGYRISKMVAHDDYIRRNFHRYNALSIREKEIIVLIVEGKSSYEIATLLFRSIHTINTHRKNIIHKLEVNSLAGLIKFAVAFNLM